jgi:hypothetical protein
VYEELPMRLVLQVVPSLNLVYRELPIWVERPDTPLSNWLNTEFPTWVERPDTDDCASADDAKPSIKTATTAMINLLFITAPFNKSMWTSWAR